MAETLTWLTTRYPAPLAVEVGWDGEATEAEEAVVVAAAELATLARTSRLGTKTRYLTAQADEGRAAS